MWHRVFGTNDVQSTPEAILAHLQTIGPGITARFHGDGAAWFQAEIVFAATTPIHVQRFLASEEGIRAELNTWAAFLETCDYSPNYAGLMEHMIQTKQLFTIRKPIDFTNEVVVDAICLGLAQFFARVTDGVYQIDQQGFFKADGELILEEF
jgi:hypothetical protein